MIGRAGYDLVRVFLRSDVGPEALNRKLMLPIVPLAA